MTNQSRVSLDHYAERSALMNGVIYLDKRTSPRAPWQSRNATG